MAEEDDDEFGEYHQVNPIVAPVPQMDLLGDDEDEFG